MAALILGFAASVCWGIGDYIGGTQTKRVPGVLVVLASQAVGLVALAPIVFLQGGVGMPAAALAAAAVAGVATGLGSAAFFEGLAIGTMSVVAPISATGVIVPVLIGIADGDRPTTLQGGGMAMAILGVVLAAQVSDGDPGRRGLQRSSIVLAVVAAVLIGLSLAALDRAGASGALPTVTWARVAAVVTLSAVVLCTKPDLTEAGAGVLGLVTIGLLNAGGALLFITAAAEGLLSVAALSGSLYPISTILLARVLLRERLQIVPAVGIFLALSGVAIVAAG